MSSHKHLASCLALAVALSGVLVTPPAAVDDRRAEGVICQWFRLPCKI